MEADSFELAREIELRYDILKSTSEGLNSSLYSKDSACVGGGNKVITLSDEDRVSSDGCAQLYSASQSSSAAAASSSVYARGEDGDDYLLRIEAMITRQPSSSQMSSSQYATDELSQLSVASGRSDSSTGMSNARKLFLTQSNRLCPESLNPVITMKGLVDIEKRYSDWEVVLLIDVRERDYHSIQTRMMEKGVVCEIRQLPVGDFLWIARKKAGTSAVYAASSDSETESGSDSESDSGSVQSLPTRTQHMSGASATVLMMGNARAKKKPASKRKKTDALTGTGECREIILDCIAERKTNADLSSSIMDGRYVEQKRRLIRSGLRCKLYVVECISMADHPKCTGVRTAVAETSTSYDMRVVRTRNLDHTINVLQAIYFQSVERFKQGSCYYTRTQKGSSGGIFSSITAAKDECLTDLYLSWTHFKTLTAKKSAATVGELFGIQSVIYDIATDIMCV